MQTLFGSKDMRGWFKVLLVTSSASQLIYKLFCASPSHMSAPLQNQQALLQFLTAVALEIPTPKNQLYDTTFWQSDAPVIATTTHKLVLNEGDDMGIADEDIDDEQTQLDQRITYVRLKQNIRKAVARGEGAWSKVKPAKVCPLCFSRICREGQQKYEKDPTDPLKGPPQDRD